MKILYVITKGNWGGAQKYVFELATHLPHPEYEVKVVCGKGDILPEKLRAAWIPVIELPRLGRDISVFDDIAVFFNLINIFRKERPDIVHLNSSKIGGIGALAARIAGIKKIIFTVHGFAFNENRPWIQKKIIACVSWLTIVFCTDVIFISEREKNQALHWPGIQSKATRIYNGIESPKLLETIAARQTLADLIGKPSTFFDGKKIIGTIGELTENKGYRYALEAVRNIPNIAYIIIGQGEQEKELQSLCQKEGLTDKVFFAGFVKDASHLLQAFDLFLLPSLKEGVPYVILEAGFAEIPVIATDVGGIREIITHQKSGIIIPPQDPQAITQALLQFLQDEQTYKNYGIRLHQHVLNTFTLGTMLDKTVALYSHNTL